MKKKHKTNAQKKQLGTYREDRHGDVMEESLPKTEVKLIVPKYFNQEQTELFNDIVELLTATNTLQKVGMRFIELFCYQYKIYKESLKDIEQNGITITVAMKYGDTNKKNPAVDVANGAFSQMITIADRFGFTPLAQSKIHVVNGKNKGKDEDTEFGDL